MGVTGIEDYRLSGRRCGKPIGGTDGEVSGTEHDVIAERLRCNDDDVRGAPHPIGVSRVDRNNGMVDVVCQAGCERGDVAGGCAGDALCPQVD